MFEAYAKPNRAPVNPSISTTMRFRCLMVASRIHNCRAAPSIRCLIELISYAVGLNPDASVRQVEILAYRESHGGEIRLPAWRKQFAGKSAKSGDLRIGAGINNISGATLSCTHVTDGVRRIAAIAQVALAR